MSAVIKIVTTYTSPGQRVLLLSPPDRIPSSVWSFRIGGAGGRNDSYAGLSDAAWTVVRLGRGVHTHTATRAERACVDDHVPNRPGPGPDSDGQSHLRPRQIASTEHGPQVGLDLFDLIIATVHPRDTGWVHATDWRAMLTTRGVLATVTHSDIGGGVLTDPTGPLTRAAQRAGLAYLDHVALLKTPLAATSAERTGRGAATSARAHADLLVFACEPGGEVIGNA